MTHFHLPSMGRSTVSEANPSGGGVDIPTRNASHSDLPTLGR
jgi:hypothetical protein